MPTERDRWSFWERLRDTLHQTVSLSGAMMVASFVITAYVAVRVPERSMTDMAVWSGTFVFNHTGRWIFPQFFAAKYGNGTPKPGG